MFKNSMQKKLRSRFHVTPVEGFGLDFDGILISCDRGVDGYSVFADVTVYPDESDPEKIQGDFYFPNANIACSQLVS